LKNQVYLADLTHTENGIMSLTFPLGTAFVATYAKYVLSDQFDFRLFKFVDRLTQAISESPPRVLAISNYSWNLELGYKLSTWAKRQHPNLIVVFGGPNFPVEADEKLKFLRQRSAIDVYIENEGEVGFAALLRKFEEYDFDITTFKRSGESVGNCTYLNGSELIEGGITRIKDVNDVPSPYLTGILDEFFDLPLTPMVETTRGCPFTCSFCADGLVTKNKVVGFHGDRVRDELYYIAERIKNIDEVYITDLNFGMYRQDLETAQTIANVQSEFNWPARILATTGKNRPDRIIEVAALLKGSWITGPAIQSSNQEVLKNVKRSNISVEAYREFSAFMKSQDKEALTFTEIILGLPGDTKETHFESLRYGIDNRLTKLKSFQAMLLTGTDMASKETRDKFELVGKFRISAGGVGIYKFGEEVTPVAENHEIIVASKDMSFEDHLSCRVMHLLLEAYYNQSQFEEIFAAMRTMALSEFDFLKYIHDHEELYTKRVKEIIDRYISAMKENLFDSSEEAQAFATSPDRVNQYVSGELGFNELVECNSLLYFEMEETLEVLLKALHMYLTEKGLLTVSVQDYFSQLGNLILCKKKEINKPELLIEQSFNYDFESIDDLNYMVDPRSVSRTDQPICFKFSHTREQQNLINNGLGLYKNHPDGIGRLLYGSNLQKMYRTFQNVGLSSTP